MRLAALIVSALLIAAPASAQTPESQAAAQKMFDDAMALMAAGKYPAACSLLEESQRLDAGMATQFRLAECYEKADRLASAWTTFIEVANAAQAAARKDREVLARERAEALKPKLSYLVIKVPDSVANTPGLQIKRDGIVIGRPQWDTAVPVDSGQHAIEAVAPDRKPWSTDPMVNPGPGTTTITLPNLIPVTSTPTSRANVPDGGAEPGRWSTQRTVGVIVGGLGVAGAVVGTVFGVRSFGKNDDSSAHCTTGTPDRCDDLGLELRSDATEAATVSTVMFAVGGTALAAGIVLFVTAPPRASDVSGSKHVGVGLTAGPLATGLSLHGAW
jgi:serine/threonine-protein kinase